MPFSPVLVLHIGAGIIGILSGAAALALRKGARGHRVTGGMFVVSMLGLSASGAYLGFMRDQMLSGYMGVLTFYLVTTAWLTARRKAREVGLFAVVALVVPLAVGVGLAISGFEAANSQSGSERRSAGGYFVFASIALLLAGGDVRMLVGGGASGTRRIVRHLWRMCLALFFATASLFLGQPQVFPAALRNTVVLVVPSVLPLIVMVFWLFRVRFTRAYTKEPTPRGGDVYPVGRRPSTSPARQTQPGTVVPQ
jgi:hypothetical protein